MSVNKKSNLTKLKHALPWLARYPFVRGKSLFEQTAGQKHIIFTVANHFEPAWEAAGALNLDEQRRRLDDYHKLARKIGEAVTDGDGTKFRHTHFYPAEQYNRQILEKMAEMQAEGLGEVEIHLHHGVEKPDTAENLRKVLTDFRDCLAAEHKCLSRFDEHELPRYANKPKIGANSDGKSSLPNSTDRFCPTAFILSNQLGISVTRLIFIRNSSS